MAKLLEKNVSAVALAKVDRNATDLRGPLYIQNGSLGSRSYRLAGAPLPEYVMP